jgi:hypothetical protein
MYRKGENINLLKKGEIVMKEISKTKGRGET